MKSTALALFTALGLSTFALAQEATTEAVRAGQTESTARQLGGKLVKCSTIQSMAVQNPKIEDGERQLEKVADFADLILDGKTGEPQYVLLSRGGLGAIGDTLIAVPVGQLNAEWKLEEGEEPSIQLLTDLTDERLSEAPEFSEDAWDKGDDAWRSELDGYYGTTAQGRVVDAGSEDEAGTQEAGMRKLGLVRLSEIIGTDVKDAAGETLANVDNVVIDPSSMQIAYVVIGSGGVLGIGEELRAVAPSALMHQRDDEGELHCSTRMTQAQLEAAPAFTGDDWKLQGTREFADRVEAATQVESDPVRKQ